MFPVDAVRCLLDLALSLGLGAGYRHTGRGLCLPITLLFVPSGVIALGRAVTIRCQCRCEARRLFLKAGDPDARHSMDPAGDVAEFPIRSVSQRDAGSYRCRYSTNDPVELVVAGREYPKPTIWVSPSRVVALGGSVTIRCEGQYPGMEFVLHKPGHSNPQGWTVRDGTAAEFPIPSVGREDGGSYTCEYHSITDQNRWSYLSDPVEIIPSRGDRVTGGFPSQRGEAAAGDSGQRKGGSLPPEGAAEQRGLSQATHQLGGDGWTPAGGVSLGGAVSVRCWGKLRGVRFVLNKQRRHFPPVDSDGSEVVFRISNVSREHGGNYSCSYHSRSEPFAVSYPSDPMELVVRGEGPGSASLFPAPPPARPSWGFGANGTLRARLCGLRFPGALGQSKGDPSPTPPASLSYSTSSACGPTQGPTPCCPFPGAPPLCHPWPRPFLPLPGAPPLFHPQSCPVLSPPLQPCNPFATFFAPPSPHFSPKTGEALSPASAPGAQRGARVPQPGDPVAKASPTPGSCGGPGSGCWGFSHPARPAARALGPRTWLGLCGRSTTGHGGWGGPISKSMFQPLPSPRQMLVLFPQGEPTRPSLERRRLPPAWAAQSRGGGGIY
uniref:Ig-like domain-containing protein n=1 Tax=Gopherus evgoodei TaxID=1825980 RepID=A0A8C4XZP7_9SAUR